jgi:glycosyltransferase involved in cell wall biosynthesis
MFAGVDLRLPGIHADAVKFLPAFDVFVHPCPSDNQPLAVLEAMGAGLPGVVAGAGGSAVIVDDGRAGLKAPATAEGMAAAVGRLLADGEPREKLATGGQAEVNANLTASVMTERLQELYDRLLGIARVGLQSMTRLPTAAFGIPI